MNTPHPILAWLKQQVGVAEIPGGPANDGDPMRLYCNGETKPGSRDGWEWCAAMMRKGFEVIGYPLPHDPKYKYARGQRELWSAAEMCTQLARLGREVMLIDARPGDLVFFPRGAKLVGHVGGVVGVEASEDRRAVAFHTIEGNVSDAVRELTHHAHLLPSGKWDTTVRVMRWPPVLRP